MAKTKTSRKRDTSTVSSQAFELETVQKKMGVCELSVRIAKKFAGNKREDVENWLNSAKGHTVEIIID